MRPSLTFSILLLSLVVFEVQGIKLEKGLIIPEAENEFQKKEIYLTKRSNRDGEKEAILCNDEQCCSGNNRKLISLTQSTTSTTLSKRNKNSKHRVDHNSNGVKSIGSNHEVATANENYSIDIVEMDYSLASGTPPIHN